MASPARDASLRLILAQTHQDSMRSLFSSRLQKHQVCSIVSLRYHDLRFLDPEDLHELVSISLPQESSTHMLILRATCAND